MNDRRLELIVGNLLRAGVLLAAVIVAAGGAWYLAESGAAKPDYHVFQAQEHGLRGLAAKPGPELLMMIGLLVMIATPTARVVLSLAAFALERDRVYVAITLIVLAVLCYGVSTAL